MSNSNPVSLHSLGRDTQTAIANLSGPEEAEVSSDGSAGSAPRVNPHLPFPLRFRVVMFGIPLGLGAQALLWRRFVLDGGMARFHVPEGVNITFWFAAVAATVAVSLIYMVKLIRFPRACLAEFRHPVASNFFFMPPIIMMLLVQAVPRITGVHIALFYIPSSVVFVLQVHTYARWLRGEIGSSLRVGVNPVFQLAVVGNFVAASLGSHARGGWNIPATDQWAPSMFLFSTGVLYWILLLSALHQRSRLAIESSRIPGHKNNSGIFQLSEEMHPVLFMYIAPPSAAAIAWQQLHDFDELSEFFFSIAVLFFMMLAWQAYLFADAHFNISWWAYTFPTATFATAAVSIADTAPDSLVAAVAAFALAIFSVIIIAIVAVCTLHHFFVAELFPASDVPQEFWPVDALASVPTEEPDV